MNSPNLEKITEATNIWTPELDTVLPINGVDIPDFQEWINWSGWKGYSERHTAYDFAAYLTKDNRCVLGLPQNTPIRAVADGVIRQISTGLVGSGVPYATFMNIEHGIMGSGLFTAYHHINPLIEEGREVKRGDVIATPYKDEGDIEGKLVHLHFIMSNGWGVKDRIINPATIFPQIDKYKAVPQGSPQFRVLGLEKQHVICIANFKKLLVNGS